MTDQSKDDIQIMEGVLAWFEEPAHWTKGEMAHYVIIRGEWTIATCLLGGIEYAITGCLDDISSETPCDAEGNYTKLHKIIQGVILEQYPDRVIGSGMEISDFNDSPATEITDIRVVCEKTLGVLREQVQP